MVPNIDIRPDHWDIVEGLLSRHVPDREVWAFGSRAKWTAKPYSDLDLAILGDEPLLPNQLSALQDDFSESSLPWKVDVVEWARLSDSFKQVIERDHVVVQRRHQERALSRQEWSRLRIREFAEVFDGPHATPPKTTAGPVFLGITSLVDGRLDLSSAEHLSEEDYVRWTRRVEPMPGDLVFSYEAKIGAAALIPQGLRCCLGRRMGLIRVDRSRVDSRFLLYQFLGDDFQALLRSRTIPGSTVDRISLKEFPDFEMALPPLVEQQRIARILGALDDKIDLNRRMSLALEAIAQAIFKSWFVGLEHVRAKASDLIAEGLLVIGDGYRAKNEELGEVGMPFIRAGELDSGFDMVGADRLRLDRLPWAKTKLSQVGDVAFTSKGTVGRFARVGEHTEAFVYSPQVCFWRSLQHDAIHPAILFCWMRSDDFISQIMGAAGQTEMAPYVSLRDQRAMSIPRFDRSQIRVGDRIAPLLRLVSEKQAESRTLSKLRDQLLPRLLSGELVPAAA